MKENSPRDIFERFDSLFFDAAEYVVRNQVASAVFIQRNFSIGYYRACKIIEQLEEVGVVGKLERASREIYIKDLTSLEETLDSKGISKFKDEPMSDPEYEHVIYPEYIEEIELSEEDEEELKAGTVWKILSTYLSPLEKEKIEEIAELYGLDYERVMKWKNHWYPLLF